MTQRVPVLCLVSLLSLLGCSSAEPSERGLHAVDSADDAALPDGVTASPDGAGYCCPIAPEPLCSCTEMGGFSDTPDRCVHNWACDAAPSVFERGVDQHGCPRYRLTGFDSCLGGGI